MHLLDTASKVSNFDEKEKSYNILRQLLKNRSRFIFIDEHPGGQEEYRRKINPIKPGIFIKEKILNSSSWISASKFTKIFSEPEELPKLIGSSEHKKLGRKVNQYNFLFHYYDADIFFHKENKNGLIQSLSYNEKIAEFDKHFKNEMIKIGNNISSTYKIFMYKCQEIDIKEYELSDVKFYADFLEKISEMRKFLIWRRRQGHLNLFETLQEDTLVENFNIGVDKSDFDHSYGSLRASIFSTDFGNFEYVGFADHFWDTVSQTKINIPECFWSTKGLIFEIVDGLVTVSQSDFGSFRLTFNSFCAFFFSPINEEQKDGKPTEYNTHSMFDQLISGQYKNEIKENFINFSSAVLAFEEKTGSYPLVSEFTFTSAFLAFLNLDTGFWDTKSHEPVLNDLVKYLPCFYPYVIIGLANGPTNIRLFPNFLSKTFLFEHVLNDPSGSSGYLSLLRKIAKDLKTLKLEYLADSILLAGSVSLLCVDQFRCSGWTDTFRFFKENSARDTILLLFSAVKNFPFDKKNDNYFYFFSEFFDLKTEEKLEYMDKITQGESKICEFKSTFSLDLRTKAKDKRIEHSAVKSIAGFLNSTGGTLFIGINDHADIVGLDWEIKKFHKSQDKFLLYFKDVIKDRIGPKFFTNLKYQILEMFGSPILVIECSPSEQPVWIDKKDLYVRTNPATERLEGPALVEYIEKHFKQ